MQSSSDRGPRFPKAPTPEQLEVSRKRAGKYFKEPAENNHSAPIVDLLTFPSLENVKENDEPYIRNTALNPAKDHLRQVLKPYLEALRVPFILHLPNGAEFKCEFLPQKIQLDDDKRFNFNMYWRDTPDFPSVTDLRSIERYAKAHGSIKMMFQCPIDPHHPLEFTITGNEALTSLVQAASERIEAMQELIIAKWDNSPEYPIGNLEELRAIQQELKVEFPDLVKLDFQKCSFPKGFPNFYGTNFDTERLAVVFDALEQEVVAEFSEVWPRSVSVEFRPSELNRQTISARLRDAILKERKQ